jgi:hypothetical protein
MPLLARVQNRLMLLLLPPLLSILMFLLTAFDRLYHTNGL